MTLEDDVLFILHMVRVLLVAKTLVKKLLEHIGDQKNSNYALRSDMTKEEFVKEVLTGSVHHHNILPKMHFIK